MPTCSCTSNAIKPDTPCVICAEKHFAAAMQLHLEAFYTAQNRHRVLGNLSNAEEHLVTDHPGLAQRIRDLRHLIHYRREKDTDSRWNMLSTEMDQLVSQFLSIDPHGFNAEERKLLSSMQLRKILPSGCSSPMPFQRRIYVFSNVTYPPKNRIDPDPEDLLVFLNKANSFNYYPKHERKLVFHRSPKRTYGDPRPCRNIYIFSDDIPCETIPAAIQKEISAEYDYEYDTDKVKCPTTGFYTVQYLRKVFPHAEIILVNMGNDVKNSTYRYPAHNWHYEHTQLAKLPHLSLE